MTPEAAGIIERLRLQPHPEGGHYAETYRHQPPGGGRGVLTAIYYLLAAGEESRWHRVKDATEIWLYHAGGPLELRLSPDGKRSDAVRLGPNLAQGERPQAAVPANFWPAARPLGDWGLVTCTVAPAFEFSAFEMAPPGWEPGR
ncbi:MAG: cupin domain-containing protein [Dongiaceae bacterium]